MARMHSRDKGKSGSTKPVTKKKHPWVRYGANEVEQLVAKLGKSGKTASQIGIILRDTYGIPDVKIMTEKTVVRILKEKKLYPELPEDFLALVKKQIKIQKHLEKNRHDMPSKRGLQLTESKIRRLVKYYKKTKKLPKDWTYDPEKARLLIG